MSWHVYPTNDEKEHDTESLHCWCNPEVQWIDPENGQPHADGPLVIHNAADCREVVEEAERIKEQAT